MSLTKEAIMAVISGVPKSRGQIAQELGIKSDESKGSPWVLLGEMLDELKFTRIGLVDTAVDHKASGQHVTGDNTYRYYRIDEAVRLEQDGILGPIRKVEIWRGLGALAVLTNAITLRRDDPILTETIYSRPPPKRPLNRK